MKLQSHWQLQKLISKTYATIPRNLTKSAMIAQHKELAERSLEGVQSSEGRRSDRQSPRHDSTITALHAWLLTFELSRDYGQQWWWWRWVTTCGRQMGQPLEMEAKFMSTIDGQTWLENSQTVLTSISAGNEAQMAIRFELETFGRIYELWQHKRTQWELSFKSYQLPDRFVAVSQLNFQPDL